MKRLLRKMLGYCGNCRRYFVYPKRRRMSTAYVDKESNYCEVCLDCYEDIEEYWKERWEEYWSGRL